MSRLHKLPLWAYALLVAFAVVVTMRYLALADAGADHLTIIRTYAFWAVVCVPVAFLGDMIMRTASEYRIVRLVRARVRTDRYRR